MRIGNHLPDNLKANGQYGGFYLISKNIYIVKRALKSQNYINSLIVREDS